MTTRHRRKSCAYKSINNKGMIFTQALEQSRRKEKGMKALLSWLFQKLAELLTRAAGGLYK